MPAWLDKLRQEMSFGKPTAPAPTAAPDQQATIDALKAQVATLTQERDEARGEAERLAGLLVAAQASPATPAAPTQPAPIHPIPATPIVARQTLFARYIDRDDFMKALGTGYSGAVTLDGRPINNGIEPALSYFTQADGSISTKPPAAVPQTGGMTMGKEFEQHADGTWWYNSPTSGPLGPAATLAEAQETKRRLGLQYGGTDGQTVGQFDFVPWGTAPLNQEWDMLWSQGPLAAYRAYLSNRFDGLQAEIQWHNFGGSRQAMNEWKRDQDIASRQQSAG